MFIFEAEEPFWYPCEYLSTLSVLGAVPRCKEAPVEPEHDSRSRRPSLPKERGEHAATTATLMYQMATMEERLQVRMLSAFATASITMHSCARSMTTF